MNIALGVLALALTFYAMCGIVVAIRDPDNWTDSDSCRLLSTLLSIAACMYGLNIL